MQQIHLEGMSLVTKPISWHWSPRLRLWTLLLFGIASLGFPLVAVFQHGLSGDVWWIWLAGQWMVHHGHIILREPPSWTGPVLAHRPWINLEWLWQILLYAIAPQLAPGALVGLFIVCEMLMMASFLWAMKGIAPKLPIEFSSLLYTIYALFFFTITARLRADLFSYIAFPLLLGLLWRSRKNPKWLAALGPLTLIWANIHGSWLMIPVLVGLEILVSLLSRQFALVRTLVLSGWVIPLTIVIVLTPSHLKTITYAWWLDHNSQITTYIVEWHSVNFHVPLFAAMAIAVLGLWIWRSHTHVSYPLILDLWLGGISFMFFDEVRMVTYFGMVLVVWIGYGISQQERLTQFFSQDRRPATPIYLGTLIFTLGVATSMGLFPYLKSHVLMAPVPMTVISWINQHPHQGIFNPEPVGGFLLAHHVSPIFLDGRADFYLYNGHHFQWYVRIMGGHASPSGMRHEFQKNHVHWILWPRANMNASLGWFIHQDHWKKIYGQHGWVIYAKP